MYNRFKLTFLFLILLIFSGVLYAGRPTTFQELMNPGFMPDAQFGMEVNSVELKDGILTAETTGAKMKWILGTGRISFEQKIGHNRVILYVETVPITKEPVITHKGPGIGFVDFSSPNMELRINGDSLFMIHVHEPVRFVMRKNIIPMHRPSYGLSSHLLLDEWGGFGIYCSQKYLDVGFNEYAATVEGLEIPRGKTSDAVTATYNMPTGEVLWIGICPPKPYDWKKSLEDRILWHWFMESGYPTDKQLEKWTGGNNIYLLQSEVMLWLDWNLAFKPRQGMDEWKRFRDKVHRLGDRFIVYTSPAYFLKDSIHEASAFNTFDNFVNWPPYTTDGENIDLFLSEITKVMTELKPDGLYFDGQYLENPAGIYRLARESRRIVGEKGLLEWHSTTALGDPWRSTIYIPQADAYVDHMLRGELCDGNFDNPSYLRHFVSCYNSSNTVGHLCFSNPAGIDDRQARMFIENNVRLQQWWTWAEDANLNNNFQDYYCSRLKPDLKEDVEKLCDKRQQAFKDEWSQIVAEYNSIRKVPVYGKPVFEENFSSIPAWKRHVSPRNSEPFSIGTEGALKIKAYGHTYAYLQKDNGLPGKVCAVETVINHCSDQGMAWGPGVAVQWAVFNSINISTRADGVLSVVINMAEHLLGPFDKDKPVHIRARWGRYFGVVESSTDGINWREELLFEHNGIYYDKAPVSLFVGKLTKGCEPADHTEPGSIGEGIIDYVRLY